MPDYEKLKGIKFDIEKMMDIVNYLEETFEPYYRTPTGLSGWSVQRQPNATGVTSSFGAGIHGSRKITNKNQKKSDTDDLRVDLEKAKEQNFMREMFYTQRTEACVGYLNEILDTFENLGLPLYRTRLIKTKPYEGTALHYDTRPGNYFVRLHIPIYTPKEFRMLIEDNEYYCPADGSVYLIKTDRLHGSINRSNEYRYTLMASVYDFNGVTENYKCTPAEKEKLLKTGGW